MANLLQETVVQHDVERAGQISVVVQDLIGLLLIWNSQASAGLDVNALAGLRDELSSIDKEFGNSKGQPI